LEPSSVLAAIGHPGVRVWILLGEPKTARAFFTVQERPGQAPRYLVTDVVLENGLDELGIERLGQVVYLSAMALWAGTVETSRQDVEQELQDQAAPGEGSPRAEPPPPAAALAVPTIPDASTRITIATGFEYTARFDGDEGVANVVGVAVSALQQGRSSELGGRLRAGLVLPRQTTQSGVELDTQGETFSLGVAAARKVGSRTWIPGEIGFGLDVVRYRTGALANPSFQPTPGGVDVRPVAYARCGARFDLGAVNLGIDAVLDVELVRAHYDVSEDGQRVTILVPWLVHPGLSAGVSW